MHVAAISVILIFHVVDGWASDGVAARGFVNGRGPPRSGGRDSTEGAYRADAHPFMTSVQ